MDGFAKMAGRDQTCRETGARPAKTLTQEGSPVKKAIDNKLFAILLIIAVLLTLNIILPRLENPRSAFAENGSESLVCGPVTCGSVTCNSVACSADGKYVFFVRGDSLYRSKEYGLWMSFILAK